LLKEQTLMTAADIDLIPLPRVPRELAALTGANQGPGYRRCYTAALDGAIPTEMRNGRHFVRRTDLPQIARALGLSVPPSAPAGTAKRRKPITDLHAAA
jgi:hypothetical protein